MSGVSTARLERKLRALYLRWVRSLPGSTDPAASLQQFLRQARGIIMRYGGVVAFGGTRAGFPEPVAMPLDASWAHVVDALKEAVLRGGWAVGAHAREIARRLRDAGIDQAYHKLERFARTETVRAHWQRQWADAEGLDDIVMVWGAERGSRTCPWCLAKDGLVVKDKTVRDHPNGRCTLVPTLKDKVPLRGKGPNPQFLRRSWSGELPDDPAVQQALRGGLNRSIVANKHVQQSLGYMVGQGWSSAGAGRHLLRQLGGVVLSRDDWSLLLRCLEAYAQQLWEGLRPGSAPRVLWRGGEPNETGLSSWTGDPRVAELYAVRHKGAMYRMQVPKGVHTYTGFNPQQDEYLVLGMPGKLRRSGVVGGRPLNTGVMDGFTVLTPEP